MQQPQQKRSADSLERVIQSAERLLRQMPPEDLTIAQVVADSGVSVGSIYARFNDKQGVFAELVLRFMRTTLAVFETHDRQRWQALSLGDALTELVTSIAAIYAQHRGVLRAIGMRSRLAHTPGLQAALDRYNKQVTSEMHELLMLHVYKFNHPHPGAAIQMCIDVSAAMLQAGIVTAAEAPSKTAPKKAAQKLLVESVVDLLYRYLTAQVAE